MRGSERSGVVCCLWMEKGERGFTPRMCGGVNFPTVLPLTYVTCCTRGVAVGLRCILNIIISLHSTPWLSLCVYTVCAYTHLARAGLRFCFAKPPLGSPVADPQPRTLTPLSAHDKGQLPLSDPPIVKSTQVVLPGTFRARVPRRCSLQHNSAWTFRGRPNGAAGGWLWVAKGPIGVGDSRGEKWTQGCRATGVKQNRCGSDMQHFQYGVAALRR